jgi:PAS domain S-box-containing protein
MSPGNSQSTVGGTVQVLHVDDDQAFLDLAATFLERHDLDVVTATDADAGLAVLDDHDVDCVVSDYDMPGRDGLAFLEAVRAEYPDLPFVLFTGKGDEGVASDAISAGVTDYLQKDTGTDQYTLLANRVRNAVDRERSKRALGEHDRRLNTLIQNLPGMAYRSLNEPCWPMEFVGGEVESLSGYTADAIESGDVVWGEDVLHPEDRETAWQTVQDAVAAGEPFELTYRIETADGRVRHVWERGRGVGGTDDDPLTIEGFITDITDRIQRERELERRNARQAALFEQSPDMINIHDGDGVIVEANRRFCEELGYDEDEVVGKNVWDVDADAEPGDIEAMREETSVGDLRRIEATFERADGSTFPAEAHLTRLDTEGAEEYLVFSRNVEERVARDRELQRLREGYETVFEHAQDALFLVSVDGDERDPTFVFDTTNPAHEALTGVPTEELVGKEPGEVFDDEAASQIESKYRTILDTGETVSDEDQLPFPGGDRVVSVKISPVVVDGEVTQLVGISRDTTERRERERELERQNDRLEEFASIVSHDLRNPLNVAEGYLQMAQETGDTSHLEEVVAAHDRMRTLIDDILTLAREGTTVTDFEVVDLSAVADDCWSLVEAPDAALTVRATGTALADRSRLRQIFENLYRNAVEHGGEGVTIEVGDLEDGFYVADDGPGVPREKRETVFESGYTTSRDGTGFGLTIVAEIAEAHDWTVEVTDSEEGGARFEVRGVEFA